MKRRRPATHKEHDDHQNLTCPHLEDDLARARPRLVQLACDLASSGDRTATIPPDLMAGAMDSTPPPPPPPPPNFEVTSPTDDRAPEK